MDVRPPSFLPRGVSLKTFGTIDSTNNEALRQIRSGKAPPFWITARAQTRGRGRGSHVWASPPGNLYATLAISAAVEPRIATSLSFAAALAAHDAVSRLLPDSLKALLRLKWPNDIMLGAAKLGGILLETAARREEPDSLIVIIGIGLNIAIAPELTECKAAHAGLEPGEISYADAFAALAHAMHLRLAEWNNGSGFGAIRIQWLERAYGIGQRIMVSSNGGVIHGVFMGIAADGALTLKTDTQTIRQIFAGEVSVPL